MKIKTFLMSMLAIATLASCNKDEGAEGVGIVQEGVPTIASITLSQSNKTRAGSGSEAATIDESAIKTAIVFVFKNDGILEKKVVFAAADIAASKKVFPITSGSKTIHAVVNMPSALFSGFAETVTTLTAFERELVSITNIGSVTTPVATGDGWWMTTSTRPTSTVLAANITESDAAAGNGNSEMIEVGRYTAKIGLSLSPSATVIGGTFVLNGYKMVNNPKTSYLAPFYADAALYYTPNYAEVAVTATDYFSHLTYTTADSYVTENTHQTPMMGNSTTAVIRGLYTPAAVLAADGTPSTQAASGDFWRIRKSDYTYTGDYYAELPNLSEIAAKTGNDAGAVAVEYLGGQCFYRLLVADNSQTTSNKKYAVLRNHYYKISIVNVNGAGASTEGEIEPGQPGQPDVDAPVEELTHLNAIIQILPWAVVEQNGGI